MTLAQTSGWFLEFPINVPAVPESHKDNQEHLIPDLVDDAVVSHPDSVKILFAGEGLYAVGAGITG
jgi:hypothetical protein